MKRSPLRRRSRIKAATPPGVPQSVRLTVLSRDGHRCLTCGTTRALVVNHRRSGMGGNRPQTPEQLTTACESCNLAYEDHPAFAYAGGWKVRHGLDAELVPLRDHVNRQWLLRPDGSRQELQATQEAS